MSKLSLIAAIDEARGLGFHNQLLCHLPADLKYFKEKTLGKPIIMGRKTFMSIGKPLPGRQNIVVSRQLPPQEGVTVVSTLSEALILTSSSEESMVIGGARLFEEALFQATQLYLTKIHHVFEADVYFPEMNFSEWNCTQQTYLEQDEKNQYSMTFCIYERKI